MRKIRQWGVALVTLAMVALAAPAFSQWQLDGANSAITFISTKNASVAEQHSFDRLSGHITPSGLAEVTIELDSVETLIPIRNERMREMLFDTATFPLAQLSATVDPAILASVPAGGVVHSEIAVTVKLHGRQETVTAQVAIVGAGDGHLRVFSTRPVIIGAAEFGLDKGVAALQEVAGLSSISTAVPVSFHLVFNPAD